jgi:lantibiotic modifying enzyme
MLLLSRAEADGSSALCGADRLAGLRDLVLARHAAPRTAAWYDVAHGELGLRWACSRIGRVLDDPGLVRRSADWLTARLAADAHPSSAGWCKGAAGLLLSAAEIFSAAGRAELLSGARLASLVDKATRLPAGRPVDLSVCHGSSGVVQSLIAAGRLLGDPALPQRALDYQERVIERIRNHGFRTGAAGRTSLLGYMLGWSGIGDTDVMLHAVANGRAHELDEDSIPVALSLGRPRQRTPARSWWAGRRSADQSARTRKS